MRQIHQELEDRLESTFTPLTQLGHLLLEQQERALRLSENHYLVHWEDDSPLWGVVNMAALDEHAKACSTFRFRKCCAHLDLIGELCARETKVERGLPH